MKEILMTIVFMISMDANAINLEQTKQKAINKLEQEARKYKLAKDLDKLTNLNLGNTNIRLRPKKIIIENKTENEEFNFETNGKDFKLNFTLSF